MQPRFTRRMDTFAKRAKARRLELGLNQSEVARLSGLKQSDISKIENGLILKTTGLVALARTLRCEPEWLASGEGQIASERVWPFVLLKPDDVLALSPKALKSVENLAFELLEIEKGAAAVHKLHGDTVQAQGSKSFGGKEKTPDFAKKDKHSGQRRSHPGAPRKTGNG